MRFAPILAAGLLPLIAAAQADEWLRDAMSDESLWLFRTGDISTEAAAKGGTQWVMSKGDRPQVDLRFRLVSAAARGDGQKSPTLAIAGQAAYDAEGRPSSGETTVVLNKDVGVYAELKKIGELKEKGILTEEEFQKEKQRLLKANR